MVTKKNLVAKKRIIVLRLSILSIITLIILDNNFSAYNLDIDLNTSILFSCIGFALVVLGGFGRIWSSLYLEGFKTKKLIKDGPYSMVRNPLYFFSLTILLGICFAIKSIPISIALLSVFILFHVPTIINEEKVLLSAHDESYKAYYESTPRLLPNIFKYKKTKSEDRIEVKIKGINNVLWEIMGYLFLYVIIDFFYFASL
ncbi:MAG: isoprenylcysteine carboxylmethyltransferase family protein [Candidatus Marinimicrobia bacterium]|jgi:protein-S-isoprenylcysteine O-methyltransferase Ste14|nr:isoprenylcysteine carboxylmethyltransferase family protein [Candidatus Neomarinimicrobiota bacterium]MBT3944204.1 isoprenylcysteine carboxylmethyltransferase family protein [Candidatus Neomarinimicrobiota bacterium]MBT4112114.1 isoprenylcysteine carboxylmethyltransferase family protein [Candidatus Neomarinimicrobiota bacterium]MBT4316923.1 isoprenylcysteine carboxylmethyltransferase family protein [Candidatus Neomarinimicrobiota bacterium]MBT4925766.1 isoprenylcysteine carboxylmethyltransfer